MNLYQFVLFGLPNPRYKQMGYGKFHNIITPENIAHHIEDEYVDQFLELANKTKDDYGFCMFRWLPVPASKLHKSVDIVACRDLDDNYKQFESEFLSQFEESDKFIHVIRDHEQHFKWHPIMGGRWAYKPKELHEHLKSKGITDQDWVDAFANWLSEANYAKHNYRSRDRYYGIDEVFLKEWLWPMVEDHVMVHQLHASKWDKETQDIRQL